MISDEQSSGVTGGRDEKAADIGESVRSGSRRASRRKATNKERVGAVVKWIMGELKMEGKNDRS